MQYADTALFITFARMLHALVIERDNDGSAESVRVSPIPSNDDAKMKEGFIM